jgi:hypothetical protein
MTITRSRFVRNGSDNHSNRIADELISASLNRFYGVFGFDGGTRRE